MLVFVFPGQGSQKRGMGAGLFDEVPQFTAVEREIDALLGYSLRRQCLEDPGDKLKETQYTQPCLYVVNALYHYKLIADGQRPAFVAGHSLGEYNALLAAGAFDLVTGIRLVKKRGELMAQAKNGGMAAIVGMTAERITSLLKENNLTTLDVANYNTVLQTVISGPVADLDRAGPIMEKAGAKLYMRLAVSAAFHSRYMKAAADMYDSFLTSFRFNAPTIPVMSNVTGQLYPAGDPMNVIRSSLVRQIVSPVQWTQSIRYLVGAGAANFKEVGPGNVLTRLIQQIQKEVA